MSKSHKKPPQDEQQDWQQNLPRNIFSRPKTSHQIKPTHRPLKLPVPEESDRKIYLEDRVHISKTTLWYGVVRRNLLSPPSDNPYQDVLHIGNYHDIACQTTIVINHEWLTIPFKQFRIPPKQICHMPVYLNSKLLRLSLGIYTIKDALEIDMQFTYALQRVSIDILFNLVKG